MLSLILFAAVLAFTGIMRLVELAVSRARMADDPHAVVSEPALFPVMALLHAGLVFAPITEVWLLERPFSWWVGGPAIALLVAATVLRIWTLRTIGRAWNVRVVVPDDIQIATTGPYAWIRHPNYLVVVLEILALPLLHSAWISAIALTLLNGAVLARRIPTEERALRRIPAWRVAMKDRKRLIPGVF